MGDHGPGSIVPLAIWIIFMIVAVRRWLDRRGARGTVPATPVRTAAAPPAPPPAPAARRRLSPPPTPPPARPVAVQAFAQSARSAPITPSMAETLPADAAAAFPGLDLSLGEAPAAIGEPAPRRRRLRTLGGGPPIGSPGWGANAIVALEVLGPPVSLRSGATVGVPHAF